MSSSDNTHKRVGEYQKNISDLNSLKMAAEKVKEQKVKRFIRKIANEFGANSNNLYPASVVVSGFLRKK